MMFKSLLGIVFAVSLGLVGQAHAAGGDIHIPKQHWHHDGPFGTYDKAALQRGYQVYREVCSSCHGMKRIYFRNLADLGYSDAQIKAVASEYFVEDGPNDEGEMFERAAMPSDAFPSPYPNEKAARYANDGAYPVDLSLITKARVGGADYIYALLTGYKEPTAGKEVVEGKHYNKYYSGHWISMAKPISDGQVVYSDGTEATIEQASRDVAQFLTWAAEPEMDERKKLGIQVVLYLLSFAGIMYLVKRKVWSNLKK